MTMSNTCVVVDRIGWSSPAARVNNFGKVDQSEDCAQGEGCEVVRHEEDTPGGCHVKQQAHTVTELFD